MTARLLSDLDAVAPGGSLWLGVELRMSRGWHTYWKFSGDAGLPTEVEWETTPGVEVGPLHWPLPEKFTEAGDLVVYGYSDSTVLLSPVAVPDILTVGTSLDFRASVSWLVCREVCIPGDTTLTLQLPIESKSVFGRGGKIADYRSLVPRALTEDGPIITEWSVSCTDDESGSGDPGVEVAVHLKAKVGKLQLSASTPDFFPANADEYQFAVNRTATGDDGVLLKMVLTPWDGQPISELDGVLLYRIDGEEEPRFGSVKLDLQVAKSTGGSRGSPGPGRGLMDFDFRPASDETLPFGYYVLLAICGGFVLNLMPCVLPVISIKTLSFVSQAGEDSGRIRSLGIAFSAGILITFVGLALVVVGLQHTGQEIGWGFQFQYPLFVIVMAAIVFVLGLSLFGLFTIRLPGASGSLGGMADGEGLLSSFANGILATILATPCTAPILGTALGFAFSQSGASILILFVFMGFGMATPYLLLSLKPAWMKFLPRPGDWMERFKQFMGFLLMGTVVWLLWVLGHQLGMEGVVWTTAFLLCVALSCWIVGRWIDLRSSASRRLIVRVVALAVVGSGYFAFLHPILSTSSAVLSKLSSSGGSGDLKQDSDGMMWWPFSVALVEDLVGGGQHTFIDFTAEWCWTCKVNEHTVLRDEQVRAKISALDVALIKADWTNQNPEITKLLRAFGRSGVPLYVIFPAGRLDSPLVLPEVITPGLMLEGLDEAEALSADRGSEAGK